MGSDYVAGSPLPTRRPGVAGTGLPTRNPGGAAGGDDISALPTRTGGAGAGPESVPAPLPTRTSRTRRGGRHSSPYQLSLPPTAPALVLAVPGMATPEAARVAAEIAASAGSACPGAEVRIGYLEGDEDSLAPMLDELPHDGELPGGVVVPLLAGPHPEAAALLQDAVTATSTPLIITDPLGPHPLLAEVMHHRLAEAGLARAGRAGRISVGSDADGVIVLAAGGHLAVQSVGVVAVLLASRLAVPVDAASVTDVAGIRAAADRLLAARVSKVALAPCLVGPEATPGHLESIAAQTGIACAPPLGAHSALGHLVAIRYGAALDDPALANLLSS
jgi:sirohydrochlorin ferrochelatase